MQSLIAVEVIRARGEGSICGGGNEAVGREGDGPSWLGKSRVAGRRDGVGFEVEVEVEAVAVAVMAVRPEVEEGVVSVGVVCVRVVAAGKRVVEAVAGALGTEVTVRRA